MATRPAPLDESESILDEDTLRTLIGSLDKDIDREGLEIMKLSMRCELRQDHVENATKASELCYHLMEYYNNAEIVVRRIIYALEILGHRRYGYRAVRKVESVYRPPALFETTMLPERVNKEHFLLHQYLAVACRHISEECSRHFIAICANRLDQNSKNFATPCAVITKLLEENVVTVDNHEDYMEEVLVEAKVSESQLKQYHDICIRIKNNQSQRSRASTRTVDEYITLTMDRHRITIQDPGDEDEQAPLLGVMNGRGGRKRFMCCSTVLGIAGILFVLLYLGALYTAERFSINQEALLQCFDNTSVILTEVNHFVTASVFVREDTEHIGDFYHNIEVYQVSSRCSDIPGTKHTYTKSGTNLTNINETTFYALPGFSVTFSICGRTNSTIEPERLEIVLIQLPHSETIDFLHPGTNNTWKCKTRKFTLTAPDYYTILFLPPTHPTNFEFNATYMVHEIDPDLLGKHSVANHTLHKDHDNETFPLTFGGAIYSCFVATITHNPDTDKDIVHIWLSFTEQVYGFVVCGGVGGVTIVLLLVSACVIRAVTRRFRQN